MIKKYWPILTLLIIGTAIRFFHNTDISLWHDEAFSALLIRYPWSEMFYRIGLDVHPPIYYIFLRFWHYGFGDSLLSLRGFSVFFGVATIAMVYIFVKEAFKNSRAAIWSASLVTINLFQVQYVTEARMYTMGAFFAVLSAYFLTKALRNQKDFFELLKQKMPDLPEALKLKRKSLYNYLLFVLSTSVIMYTHYYLLFTMAALCLYALYFHVSHYHGEIKKYGWLFLSYVLLIILYIPWLKIFLFQLKQVSAAYWIPKMDKWSIPVTLWELIWGAQADLGKNYLHAFIILTTLFALFVLWRFLRKVQSKEKWLVILNILAPFAGSMAFFLLSKLRGQGASVFLDRYFLFSAAFFSIALGVWLENIRPKVIGKILFIVLLLSNIWVWGRYWQQLDVAHKPGMAGAAKFINTNATPKDKIYLGTSFEFFNFKYYNQTSIQPLLYTGGQTEVEALPHFAGTALLNNSDLLPNFNYNVREGDTVWLLWTNGFGSNKPEVPKNWTQIDEKGYAEVRPYVGTWVVVTEYKVN